MYKADIEELERFSFGDSSDLADSLLALVLSGEKTATCWDAELGSVPNWVAESCEA